jgi:predicted amidohydrolase
LTKIAIAQCAPALGAFKRNMDMHDEWIARARDAGAELIVFPELSLTGYYLKDLAAEIAVEFDDPRLDRLRAHSKHIDILAGYVERDRQTKKVHIAQGYFSGGGGGTVHRKVYLPTYGIFDDGRYFAPGEFFTPFESACGTAGVAICEDFWHISVPYLYALDGVNVIFCPSDSPGRGVAEGGDLGTADSCRLMNQYTAQYLTTYVVFANRVGHEDGIAFWGGSEIVAPNGTVVARAPEFEEHLLIGDVDPELVARERDRNPLIRDERSDLLFKSLKMRHVPPTMVDWD